MSQLYCLELTAEAGSVGSVARYLREVVSGADLVASTFEPETGPTDTVFGLHSGLWASVTAPVFTGPDMFVPLLGSERAVTVDMQENATQPVGRQIDEMLQVVFGLLARLPGDAVLHWEHLHVWLLRRDGRLLLNESDEIWRPDRLARVPTPYERVPLHLADSSA